MKKLIIGLMVAGLTVGMSAAYAATDEQKQQLDDQKQQAKLEYEHQIEVLKSQYSGTELDQRLQQAEADYKAKVKQLDEQQKQ